MELLGAAEVIAAFKRLRIGFPTTVRKKALPLLAKQIAKTTVRRFGTRKDPDGQPWKRWSDRYAARRKSLIHNLNIDSGDLYEELRSGDAISRDGDDIVYGSSLPYATFVQKARPVVGIDPDGPEIDELDDLLQQWADKEMVRRGLS